MFDVTHPISGHPVPVFDWHDHGIEFTPGDGHNKARLKPADLFVWHWTGGESEPDRMAKYLRKRTLGVEFAISRFGNIFQFCDPVEVDTADAGIVNSRSWGCEVINFGFRRWHKGFLTPKLGKDRGLYQTVLNGKIRKFAKFYPWQIQSAIALADAVSAASEIPATVPANCDVMTRGQLASFSGHVSHSNVSARKSDCGPELINALRNNFGQAA